MDRGRAGEGVGELVGAGDVDAAAVDERVVGTAAGAGQQSHLQAGVGELLGDGRADGAGSGDDVDGGHGIS